jgi:hypothetical protein
MHNHSDPVLHSFVINDFLVYLSITDYFTSVLLGIYTFNRTSIPQ